MGRNSQALLNLEGKNSEQSIDSKLMICKNDDLLQPQTVKAKTPDEKPAISSVPKSQFLEKLRGFLGVMSEANKKLQLDAVDNPNKYDIEALNGDESEYIEMDLMLGVADLHTPEAVAAAESAVAACQPVIPLASRVESEDSSDDDDDEEEDDHDDDSEDDDDNKEQDNDETGTSSPAKLKRSNPIEDESWGNALGKSQSKKRPKIVEL